MTGNKVLLDTNIISAWLKGEAPIADKIDNAELVYIPIIVVGELHYGAQYSTNIQKNISNINKVVTRYEVLYTDLSLAPSSQNALQPPKQPIIDGHENLPPSVPHP